MHTYGYNIGIHYLFISRSDFEGPIPGKRPWLFDKYTSHKRQTFIMSLEWDRGAMTVVNSIPVNMPEMGRFWVDAAVAGSIGSVQAQYWHIMACLQGMRQFLFS